MVDACGRVQEHRNHMVILTQSALPAFNSLRLSELEMTFLYLMNLCGFSSFICLLLNLKSTTYYPTPHFTTTYQKSYLTLYKLSSPLLFVLFYFILFSNYQFNLLLENNTILVFLLFAIDNF